MLFIPTLNKRQFESFVSLRYGKDLDALPPDDAVSFGTRYFGLRYVGLQDDGGELSAAILLFEYKRPGFPLFFYGCKGHVLENGKDFLAREFIKELKVFAREQKAMFVFPVSRANSIIEPVVVMPMWRFIYEKALPLYQKLSFRIKSLFKRNCSKATITRSCSVFDIPN